MPTGFHSYAHFHPLACQGTVELLRFLRVLQSPFLQFPCFGIRKRNLLETRVVIASYNPHVRLLSPGPWLVGTTKVYPGVGADIVMESITLKSWRASLVCLVPDPSCLVLLGWLFRITKWACQGKLAGFHIATQF